MFVLAEQQNLAIELRIRALELAGYLGDPRLAKVDLTEANRGDRTIAIAGGRYRFGMRQPIKFVGPKRVEAWPQRSVDLKPFRIARYPVTNGEYKLFLADGGYDTDRWWLEPEGRAWMRQDESFIDRLIRLWMQWYPKHYYKPEEDQLIGAMTPEGAARRILRRRQPLYWHDSRFNAPNYPVVGINWWEARAYCRWLTAHAQADRLIERARVVRLPTEWEWECAAGRYDLGVASTYPWGDEFDPAACHTRFGSLSRLAPIPVGFLRYEGSERFPADIIGNVWEWVSSRCLSYESKNDAIREETADVSADRVVRGSSWYSTEPAASQIRFRLHDQICNAYWDLGFRYVIAEADDIDRVTTTT
jgi:formylglycine-generating enzyme required for sulfatase activity